MAVQRASEKLARCAAATHKQNGAVSAEVTFEPYPNSFAALNSDSAIEQDFAAGEHGLNAIAAENGELGLTIPAVWIESRKPGKNDGN